MSGSRRPTRSGPRPRARPGIAAREPQHGQSGVDASLGDGSGFEDPVDDRRGVRADPPGPGTYPVGVPFRPGPPVGQVGLPGLVLVDRGGGRQRVGGQSLVPCPDLQRRAADAQLDETGDRPLAQSGDDGGRDVSDGVLHAGLVLRVAYPAGQHGRRVVRRELAVHVVEHDLALAGMREHPCLEVVTHVLPGH